MSDDIKKTPWELIITAVTIISVIAFLSKIFGKDKEEEKADRSRDDLYKDIPPTKRDFIYKDWADILDTAIMQSGTEDEQAVYNVCARMKNISDVNKTIQAFGTKRQLFTLQYLTLPQAISENLSKPEIKALNGILSRKGIGYQFE